MKQKQKQYIYVFKDGSKHVIKPLQENLLWQIYVVRNGNVKMVGEGIYTSLQVDAVRKVLDYINRVFKVFNKS